jgi:hypothetical protein
MILYLLQTAAPDPSLCSASPCLVKLTDEQMAQIGAQINGAALFVAAFLAVGLAALGAILYVTLIGGR